MILKEYTQYEYEISDHYRTNLEGLQLFNKNESILLCLFFDSVAIMLAEKKADTVVYKPRVGGPVQQDFS